jgi:hypothetical protein
MIDEAEQAGGYCGPRFDADRGMTRQITAIQAKLFEHADRYFPFNIAIKVRRFDAMIVSHTHADTRAKRPARILVRDLWR